jgi:capsular exopolysaccharide synthesis family protein
MAGHRVFRRVSLPSGLAGARKLTGLRTPRLCCSLALMSTPRVLNNSARCDRGFNLAQVLVRQPGQRVLLVDADLRAARLHVNLGTAASPGLSEYLTHQTNEFQVIQRGPMENCFFLPSGREVTNPAELLAGERLQPLLARLEPLFDWIIIDSPPAVPVTDASLLAKHCDGILLVVRSNVTPFDMAQKARLEFGDEQLLGVVLNGVGSGTMPYHRYYYSTHPRGDGKAAQK